MIEVLNFLNWREFSREAKDWLLGDFDLPDEARLSELKQSLASNAPDLFVGISADQHRLLHKPPKIFPTIRANHSEVTLLRFVSYEAV